MIGIDIVNIEKFKEKLEKKILRVKYLLIMKFIILKKEKFITNFCWNFCSKRSYY